MHQNSKMLALHIWVLSSNQSLIKSFQGKLQNMSLQQEDFLQGRSMMQNGRSSLIDVVKGKIKPVLASPRIIADFLLQMFEEKKCQVSTNKGYISMISNTLKFKFVTNIGSDPIISELIKTFEIQRPIQRSLAPKWDLACVLSSLCKDPYEPSHKGLLLHLPMKTVFLLTMATAKRVSEIHALAMDTEHLRSDKTDGSVSLRTQRGFLAKYQPSKSPSTIFIPNLAKTLN